MKIKIHTERFESCAVCGPKIANPTINLVWVKRQHNKAVGQRLRDQIRRDLGLVKVKGGFGGTYWE